MEVFFFLQGVLLMLPYVEVGKKSFKTYGFITKQEVHLCKFSTATVISVSFRDITLLYVEICIIWGQI